MNNLEKNSKIEIRTDGRKSYDIILKDSFDDFLKQMEFLEIEHKKICIVTESNVAPFYLKQMYDLISSKAAKTITFSFEAGEKHKQLKTIEALYEELIINHFDRQDLRRQHIFEELILCRCQQHCYHRWTAVSGARQELIFFNIRIWSVHSISQSLYISIQRH